jgi:hypothetical protein
MAKAATKKPAKPEKPKSPAEWAHDRLVMYIRNFESQLDAEQEIAMGFASDESGVLRIEGLGYFEPDIVTFYGRDDDGAKTQLIQHVTPAFGDAARRAEGSQGRSAAPDRVPAECWLGRRRFRRRLGRIAATP